MAVAGIMDDDESQEATSTVGGPEPPPGPGPGGGPGLPLAPELLLREPAANAVAPDPASIPAVWAEPASLPETGALPTPPLEARRPLPAPPADADGSAAAAAAPAGAAPNGASESTAARQLNRALLLLASHDSCVPPRPDPASPDGKAARVGMWPASTSPLPLTVPAGRAARKRHRCRGRAGIIDLLRGDAVAHSSCTSPTSSVVDTHAKQGSVGRTGEAKCGLCTHRQPPVPSSPHTATRGTT